LISASLINKRQKKQINQENILKDDVTVTISNVDEIEENQLSESIKTNELEISPSDDSLQSEDEKLVDNSQIDITTTDKEESEHIEEDLIEENLITEPDPGLYSQTKEESEEEAILEPSAEVIDTIPTKDQIQFSMEMVNERMIKYLSENRLPSAYWLAWGLGKTRIVYLLSFLAYCKDSRSIYGMHLFGLTNQQASLRVLTPLLIH
jgi:hypothetical protein